MKKVLLAVLACATIEATANAQTGLGPDFPVNVFTAGAQTSPAVGTDAAGNFVVVWDSYGQDDPFSPGIFARRFDAAGAPRGVDFAVNTFTTGFQQRADVAVAGGGPFVVVWEGQGEGAPTLDVWAQRYDLAGAAQGANVRVNTHLTGGQFGASVAVDGAGNFVVAWTSFGADGAGYAIRARAFLANGSPMGDEFAVNTYTTGDQTFASVAMNAAGRFVIAWHDGGQDGSGSGVFARRFDTSGSPLGGEFRVSGYTTGDQRDATVAVGAAGDFVVAWADLGRDGSYSGVFARRYDALGEPAGAEFQVNAFTSLNQSYPDVATIAGDDFVVLWTDHQEANNQGIYGRRFDATGTGVGPEFHVNTYTTARQAFASVSGNADGRFVAAWTSNGQDGSSYGIFGRRLATDHIFADGFEDQD
jgi:hypothetical protein